MPRISDFMLVCQKKQPTLSVHARSKVEELPDLIGSVYAELADYLRESGAYMSDVPFVAYHNADMQNLALEIGCLVPDELPGQGRLKPSFWPVGKMVFCMYRGAYNKVEPVYQQMLSFIEHRGLQPYGATYEFYYNGPPFSEEEFLTKIAMPVK